MAQQADGTVYIDTLLDTTGFKAGGKEVEAAVRRMTQTVSGIGATAKAAMQKQADSFVKANQAFARQEQKVEALKNKLKELGEQKAATDEFKEIGKQIDNDTAKLNRLEKAQEEFLAVGGKESSPTYRRREMEIEELRNSIKYAKGEQEELLNTGGAYRSVDTSGVEQKLLNEEQRLQQMNNSLATSFESLRARVQSYNGTAGNLANTKQRLVQAFTSFVAGAKKAAKTVGGTLLSGLKKTGKAIKNLASGAKQAASALLHLHKNAGKSNKSIGLSLKTLMRYGLGVRSVFALVNKLRSALVDGFKNLAQYDSRTNASISALMSSLTRLKNSFATAFAPILNVVAPVLKAFINMVSRAVTYVGMLIAALTGQDSFVRAKEVQEDYAGSLEDTAAGYKDAKKEQKGYLSGLDEIHRWESQDSSSGDSGSGGGAAGLSPGDMFERIPLDSSFKNLADRLKEMWRKADFTELGTTIGTKLKDALDSIPWERIKPAAEKVGKSIATFLNGGLEVPGLPDSIGKTVGGLVNTAISGASGFIDNFHFQSLGDFIATSMNKAISTISWSKMGTTIRNGLNGIFRTAETWSGKFDFKKLGTAVRDLINSALTKINWKSAITAARNIGGGIADALNEILTPETFGKVGDALAGSVRVVIAGVKEWVTKSDFYTWGTALGTALNNFFNGIDWEEVGLTLSGLIEGLVDFMKGLVDTGSFTTFGEKIGTALSGVPWATLLWNAAKVIAATLGDLLKGFGSTTAGKWILGIAAALTAAKLASKIFKFVDGIASILGGDRNTRVLKKTMETLLGGATQAAADTAATTVTNVGTAAGGAAGWVEVLKTAMLGIGKGAAISGIVYGGVKIAELADAAAGGNGKLTELGGSIDTVNNKLYAAGAITADQKQELFLLKEQMEDSGATIEEFGTAYTQKLSECKVSSEQLRTVVDEMGGTMNVTDAQGRFLSQTIDGLGTAAETMAGKYVKAGTDADEAFGIIERAIMDTADQTGDYNIVNGELLDIFRSVYQTTGSVDTAYQSVVNKLQEMGDRTEDVNGESIQLSQILNKNVNSALGSMAADADKAAASTEKVGTKTTSTTGEFVKSIVQMGLMALGLGGIKSSSKDAEGGISSLDTTISSWIKTLGEHAKTVLEKGREAGGNYPDGLADGIDKNSGKVNNAGKELIDGLNKSVEDAADMHSPSRVAEKYGGNYDQGLANGITGKKSVVTSAISSLVSKAFDISSTMRSKGQAAGKAFADGIKSMHVPTPNMYISSWVSHSLGNGGMLYTPRLSVQWLAHGGLVTGLTNAMLGENGKKEAVLPLENKKAMQTIAGSLIAGISQKTMQTAPIMASGSVIPPKVRSSASARQQDQISSLGEAIERLNVQKGNMAGMQNMTIRIPVILDGRQLFEAVIDEAKMKQMVSGKNPFEMAY